MRIVIIANNSNGLYLFRRQLISALIEREHEVILLTPFDTDVDNLKNLGASLVETPVDRRGTNPLKDYSLIQLYRKELKRIKPDLIITYTIKPNVYGGIVCRLLHIPYAANITGLGSAFENNGVLQTVVKGLYKTALKKAKVVFFENSFNRDFFAKERIVKRSQTHLLPGAGVDLGFFSYQPYPNNKEFKFLFIGRVMKEKGIDELLDSLMRLVGEGFKCSIDILGSYEEDYRVKLEIAQQEGWLRYHGIKSDVRPFIRDCDCFVLPSYHEGMANTNLECASSGRPLITSNIPGCREAVIDGVSGYLCEPRNVDSLYNVMKRMIEADNRAAMGQAGRKHMEDVFDKKRVVDKTIKELTR